MGRPPLPPEQRKPRLSGAQRRKLKQEKVAEVSAAAAALGLAVGAPPDPEGPGERAQENDGWAEAFTRAGEPDLENPETDLAYVRKLQLVVLHQMATTARPTSKQIEAWRRIKEMCATVGMTHPRAVLESKVKRLEAHLAEKRKPPSVRLESGDALAGTENSRGRRGARGPRPLPGRLPPPEAGEDGGDAPQGGGPLGPAGA